MKPKSVLEQLANQYTLPGGAFYMDEQGTIQTVETIADLKKYLMIKGATQVIYVKSIDRFVESDSSGVADEVTSWASTHPKRKGYRWVLQTVATASSSVASYMDFNKEGGGTVRLTFGSEGQPIYTILSCLMLLFISITGYAQSARTSPLIDQTTHVLEWPSDLWTTNAAAIAAAIPAGSLGTNQLNAQTYGLLVFNRETLSESTNTPTVRMLSGATENIFSTNLPNSGIWAIGSGLGGYENQGDIILTTGQTIPGLGTMPSKISPGEVVYLGAVDNASVKAVYGGDSLSLLVSGSGYAGLDYSTLTNMWVTPYTATDIANTNAGSNLGTTTNLVFYAFATGRQSVVPNSGWFSKLRIQKMTDMRSVFVIAGKKLSDGNLSIIYTSEDVRSQWNSFGSGSVAEITFGPVFLRAGELVGLRLRSNISSTWTTVTNISDHRVEYYAGEPPNKNDFTPTIVNNLGFDLNLYGSSAVVVFVGDSLMVGQHAAGIGVPTDTVSRAAEDIWGVSCANAGVGSQIISSIAGRLVSTNGIRGVEFAKIVRLNGGVNDIVAGTAISNVLSSYTTILDQLAANNQYVVVDAILPWTGGTTEQMQTRDDWNIDLAALCAGYTNVLFVNHDSTLGLFRAGGDAGNLWDIAAAYRYSGDSVHLNAAGYAARETNAATLARAWLKTKNVIW